MCVYIYTHTLKYINSKRKTRENVGPLLNEVVALVTGDTKKAEILNTFFASVSNAKTSHQEFQTLEVRERESRERKTSCWLRRIWSESI